MKTRHDLHLISPNHTIFTRLGHRAHSVLTVSTKKLRQLAIMYMQSVRARSTKQPSSGTHHQPHLIGRIASINWRKNQIVPVRVWLGAITTATSVAHDQAQDLHACVNTVWGSASTNTHTQTDSIRCIKSAHNNRQFIIIYGGGASACQQ